MGLFVSRFSMVMGILSDAVSRDTAAFRVAHASECAASRDGGGRGGQVIHAYLDCNKEAHTR